MLARRWCHIHCGWDCKRGWPVWKTVASYIKSNTHLTIQPSSPSLWYWTKRNESLFPHQDPNSHALIAPDWEHPTCPASDKCVTMLCWGCVTENCSTPDGRTLPSPAAQKCPWPQRGRVWWLRSHGSILSQSGGLDCGGPGELGGWRRCWW